MKVLYPTGVETIKNGEQVHGGGIEWTIKDGFCYHAPTLAKEVREMVAKAKKAGHDTSAHSPTLN